ncbi:MAG: glycosyltransferase [Planctomycetes bacterium]|nr:glycosyltransferase [Planctomycetota bacterium]
MVSTDTSPSTLPSVSVVICTRNRADSLTQTLESVWRQARRPDELIIVDDGELPAATARGIVERCRVLGIACRIEKNPRPGLTPGRNHAAFSAKGDILLFLDDDVICDDNVVGEIAEIMRDGGIAAVTARVEEPTFESRSARLYQLGYRLAGWWRIAPRGNPDTPRPKVLDRADVAVRTRILSGAAMAIRREVVLANPFDESLTTYALGEDREMGYRLAPRHWMVEARRARVIHRRDPSSRTDHRRLGFMTTRNYLYILEKTCSLGAGQYVAIGWSFAVLAMMHVVWSLGRNRAAHIAELWGMVEGVAAWMGEKSRNVEMSKSRHRLAWGAQLQGEGRYGDSTTPPRQGESPSETLPSPYQGDGDGAWRTGAEVPRRVLFVTNRLEPGGAELMLVQLARRLPASGVKPYIGCLKDGGPLAGECRADGITVFENLLHHKTDAAVIPRMRRLLAEHAIDVVVVAHSGGDRMFWSTLAAGLSEIPVVVWSHWFPEQGKHHFERANRALYRMVDVYVALGARHRAAMIRHEQVPAGRIAVIPNALDLGKFMHGVSRAEARRRLRLEEQHIAVAIIANLRREKRHDVFIEAARRLAAGNANYRFFIIGDGPNRDAVQAAAAASGLDHETLRMMGPRTDVAELLAGLDVSCLCSEVECFSVTMLEAAAAGCAFVGPNTGCLPEFLEHGRTGLLIRPADVASLADAIGVLGCSEPLRRSLADAARARVLRDYGLERMAERFADLLRRVVPKAKPASQGFRRIDSRSRLVAANLVRAANSR